jgi:hypothetical protein
VRTRFAHTEDRAMPSRLREKYLREAVEAIIRYAEEGEILHYRTEPGEGVPMRITFEITDSGRYHAILAAVMAKDADGSTS